MIIIVNHRSKENTQSTTKTFCAQDHTFNVRQLLKQTLEYIYLHFFVFLHLSKLLIQSIKKGYEYRISKDSTVVTEMVEENFDHTYVHKWYQRSSIFFESIHLSLPSI